MTPAIAQAEAARIEFRLHRLRSGAGDGDGAEAAAALGVPADRVFKTLVAKLDDRALVVAVLPVNRELDLKRLAAEAGGKRAVLASAREAERSTGYVLGGISPLGQRQPLPTFLDRSALEFATVFVSGGRRGLELELGPSALREICGARVASLTRARFPA